MQVDGKFVCKNSEMGVNKKKGEKQMTYFKSTFITGSARESMHRLGITFILKIKCSSQAMHTFSSQYSCAFCDCLPHMLFEMC